MKYTSALINVGRTTYHRPETVMMTFYPEDWFYGSKTEVRLALDAGLWAWVGRHLSNEESIRITMGSVPSMWHVQIV